MKQYNLYEANVRISQINGLFAGYDDIVETCKVLASSKRKAKKEAYKEMLNKYKILQNVEFVFNCEVEIFIENVKVIR